MLAAAAIFLAGAFAPAHAASPPASGAYEALYFKNCAVCHGEKGDGRSRAQVGLNPSPRDFTTDIAAEELSRERMILGVTYGRPGTAMVAWASRLSEDEIAGVVDFIRARFMKEAEAAPPGASRAADLEAGRRIFREHCSTCHGDHGNGASWAEGSLNPPPRDFTAPALRETLTEERMLQSVTRGRPGTAMMAFGTRLSAEDIRNVVGFIRAEFMGLDGTVAAATAPARAQPEAGSPHAAPRPPAGHAAPTPEPVDMTQAFEGGLRGDAGNGRDFYMRNCYVCHGREGDGKGPRAGFIEPPPRDFLSEESRRTLNRPALFSAIASGKRGTVMPAWKTVLTEQELADVAEYVFQAYIRADQAVDPAAKKKLN